MQQRIIYGVIGLIVVGLFGLAIYTFFRGQISNRPAAPKVLTLIDYYSSDSSSVRYTVSGPTVADEYHNSITISISKAKRQVQSFSTYANTPGVDQELSNNQPAYEDFMRALQNDGFLTTRAITGNPTEIGLCPTGQRYVYELINNGQTIQRTWGTSCGDKGTFRGAPSAVQSLFRVQIPGYTKLTQDISLTGAR